MNYLNDEDIEVGLKLFEKSNVKTIEEFFEFFKKNFPKEILDRELERKRKSNEGVYKSK